MIKKVFPVLALAMFSSNLGLGIVVPLLPVYVQRLGAAGVWIGTIMAAYGMASIISTPFFGRLSDRRGRKLFLSLGLLCYSLLSLGYILTDNISSLILVRLLQGAAGGMVLPIATAYIGDISPRGEEGKWMGYANAAFFGGFGTGPLIGGALSEHFGMTATFSFMGGLNLFALLVALLFLPQVEARTSHRAATTGLSFREIGRSKMVRGLFSFQLTQALGRGSLVTFLPVFAATHAGLGLTLIGTLISTNIILMSLLGLASGHIADRLNRRGLVGGGSLIIVLAMATIPMTGNFWQILVATVLLAVGGGLAMPAASALCVGVGRKFGMGSTIGLITMGMNIGFALGPIIAGQTVDLSGINSAFYFGGVVTLIGIGLFACYTRPGLDQTTSNG